MKDKKDPPSEKVFFFPGSGKNNLFGFLHYAASPTNPTGIVYCQPFAEEKNMSHSIIVKTARMFARAGFPVFRFDFNGCGDSEGELQFSSIQDWLQDLDAAIKVFRQETGVSQCFLWGLRSGGGLALLSQRYNKHIAGLVLWQPVLDFSVHIKQFLRRALSSEISEGKRGNTRVKIEDDLYQNGVVNVIGYPIAKDLYNSFINIGKQPADIVPSVPVSIFSISLIKEPAFLFKRYTERLKGAGTKAFLNHLTAEPFWDRYWQWECKKLAEATLRWIKEFQ